MNARAPDDATWVPAGFFHLRTPLLPFASALVTSSGPASGSGRDDPDVTPARAPAQALAGSRERLREWLGVPAVREALYLASADLDARIDAWLVEPPSEGPSDIEVTLHKYRARSCGRSTPFGLFAGTSTGVVGSEQRIELAPAAHYRRRSALDSDFVSAVARSLAGALGAHAMLRPNASLYAAAGRLCYTAATVGTHGARFGMEALTPDAPLLAALACAGDGATFGEVVDAVLASVGDVAREEADAYVRELVDRDILVTEAEPPITGRPALDALMAHIDDRARALGASRAASHAASHGASDGDALVAALDAGRRLRVASAAFAELDAEPIADGRDRYAATAATLATLAQTPVSHCFQVDLAKPTVAATLHESVTHELHAATLLLQRMFRARRHGGLADFRERFAARYEQREVPLVEALDEECGIGFEGAETPDSDPSPLLHGLGFGASAVTAEIMSPVARWLLPQVTEVLRRGGMELRISDADVARWERESHFERPAPLPDAFTTIATLEAGSDTAVREGRFRLLHGGAGAQGASTLGRFCQRDDLLAAEVRRFLHAEEALRPDAAFAEVVFRSEAYLGNVVRRPVLRAFEIPTLGRSGAPRDDQLPLTDLRISLVDGRFRLRSARLDREVIPRMSTALVLSRGSIPGAVRFLGALQTQQGIGTRFQWGALESLPVLPRVVTGRVVLALARWRLDAGALAPLRSAPCSARLDAMRSLRVEWGLPRWVGLSAGDDPVLPLDLDDVLAVEVIARLAGSGVTLTEVFPGPDGSAVRGPEGRYMHELVIPFIRRPHTGASTDVAADMARDASIVAAKPAGGAVAARIGRTLLPGGEWCTAKLYGGRALADRLLSEGIAPLVRESESSGLVDRWFFLRYADPEPHLRLRVHGRPERLMSEFLPALHDAATRWKHEGLLWKLELSTYEREIERYGGPDLIAGAEAVFAADSAAVLQLLDTTPGPDARWQQTLLGAHHLLVDWGLSLDDRIAMLSDAERRFGQEFAADAPFFSRLNARIRRERDLLGALVQGPVPDWIVERSARVRPILGTLRAALASRAGGAAGLPLSIVRDFLHLHVNRALRSSHRAQEFVIVAMLLRLARAMRATGGAEAGARP
ncbi:MAG: lantibiotic dehydratase [Gemmatimonadetes bacterium]|nr:lantibiotic dehydratase [Gemmatimonadota bacterium]